MGTEIGGVNAITAAGSKYKLLTIAETLPLSKSKTLIGSITVCGKRVSSWAWEGKNCGKCSQYIFSLGSSASETALCVRVVLHGEATTHVTPLAASQPTLPATISYEWPRYICVSVLPG